MSYYTSQISTKLIDPNVFVANLRCEFQLPKNDYGNRMRLENVGLFGGAPPEPSYNEYIGALASIKSIRLLNGRDELDSCRECNRHLSFKRFNKTTQRNISYGQPSMKNDYSIVYSGTGTGDDAGTAIVQGQTSMDLGGLANRTVQTTEEATPKAYLDLREVFPFLKTVEVLPASLFPQLRVVIEYETDVRNLISVDNQTVTTTRPLLACDVIEDKDLVMAMSKDLNGATWDAVEHDLIRIPAVNPAAANAPNTLTSRRLNGFNNKRLMRFYISKAPTNKAENVGAGNAVRGGGDLMSQALINEKFQVRINGSNKISRDGANNTKQRLSMLVDAYGECSTYYGASRVGADQGGFSIGLDGARNDYYGMYINDVVKDMEIQITRDTFANTVSANFAKPQSSGYDVHVFGDVRKALVVNGSDYQIVYA